MNSLSIDVNIADFDTKVLDASHNVPVLVDFWAAWCAPCRVLKPVLERLALEYGGRFLLAKVNSDENPELAAHYGVRGIPNVKAFVNGEMSREFTGALPETQLRAFIDSLLPSPAEPLRIAACEARARGEPDVATSLLSDARQLDPTNQDVMLDLAEIHLDQREVAAARTLLDAVEDATAALPRARSLHARLNLEAEGCGADAETLRSRVQANADDLDARLQLARALTMTNYYRAALEQLLEIVGRDRRWRDEAARKAMLDLFVVIGADPRHDDLCREYRAKLARLLN